MQKRRLNDISGEVEEQGSTRREVGEIPKGLEELIREFREISSIDVGRSIHFPAYYNVRKDSYLMVDRHPPREIFHARRTKTALDCPAEEGDEAISYELRRGMNRNWQYSRKSIADELCFAARWNRQAMLCRILDAHPELINQTEALSTACLGGHFPCVSLLIKKYGEDVNRKPHGVMNEYPLINAIFSGKFETVKFLLEQGASIEVRRWLLNESPIQCCQSCMTDILSGKLLPKYIPIFKLLVDAGSDVNEPHALFKQSPVEFVKKLEGNPEQMEKIRAILSQETCSLGAIEDLMAD